MIRILCLVGLLAATACSGTTRSDDGVRAAEGPTVSIGGSMRSSYGYVRQ